MKILFGSDNPLVLGKVKGPRNVSPAYDASLDANGVI